MAWGLLKEPLAASKKANKKGRELTGDQEKGV